MEQRRCVQHTFARTLNGALTATSVIDQSYQTSSSAVASANLFLVAIGANTTFSRRSRGRITGLFDSELRSNLILICSLSSPPAYPDRIWCPESSPKTNTTNDKFHRSKENQKLHFIYFFHSFYLFFYFFYVFIRYISLFLIFLIFLSFLMFLSFFLRTLVGSFYSFSASSIPAKTLRKDR